MGAYSGGKYANFKPELWSAQLNLSLKKDLVGEATVNRNYEGEISGEGDTVHITEPGSVTTNTYTAYSDITFEQPSETDRTLLIDQADYAAIDIDDVDEAQAKVGLMGAHTGEMSYSLANNMDSFLFLSFAQANSGVASSHAEVSSVSSTNIYARFVDASKVLDLQNVDTANRWATVSPNEVALLRQAPEFVPIGDGTRVGGGTSGSERVVATGEVGECAGFRVLQTNNLTTLSGVRKVMFGTTRATTFAQQVTELKAVDRESRFAMGLKALNVYGKKTIRAEALAVLHI